MIEPYMREHVLEKDIDGMESHGPEHAMLCVVLSIIIIMRFVCFVHLENETPCEELVKFEGDLDGRGFRWMVCRTRQA